MLPVLTAASTAAIAVLTLSVASIGSAQEKISAPNAYEGYSERKYDGHERSSFYLPVRDGTRLAVDLFRPTLDGKVVDEKLPVVWMHTPYNRRTFQGMPAASAYPGYALRLVPYGYNVALVDFRGLYASFGNNTGFNRGEWTEAAKYDAYDVTEWFADQSWSNGKIGMWGCSATGGSQMQALTTRPPSLKAVVPMSAEFDVYSFAVTGGVARDRPVAPPGQRPGANMIALRDQMAVPVDGPDGEALLEAAKAEHADNRDTVGMIAFRDSISPVTGTEWWKLSSPHIYLDELKKADIGVLSVANWDEAGTRHGPFFTYNNLYPDNTKLLVGPATHCDWSTVRKDTGFDLVTEELRFYDHWLKDIDNGVMTEPGVTYYTYNAPQGEAWRQSETWPPAGSAPTPFFLTETGGLSDGSPTKGRIETRLSAAPLAETVTLGLPEDGIAFDTGPLSDGIEVTGHPVVKLWVESAAADTDVTAFLFDVAPDGSATTYQMLGRLRATHRALAEAPYDHLGLPWRSFEGADAAPMPAGEPVELVFDMLPMSYHFPQGHKIRLHLTFSDPDREDETSKVVVLTGGDMASSIDLPVMPQ